MRNRSRVGPLNRDRAKASVAFFTVAAFLALVAGFSFFSPLALATETPWQQTIARAAAHLLPVLVPTVIGIAIGQSKVSAWHAGVLFMSAMFTLGVFLSKEQLVYLWHGHLIPPVFLLLSIIAAPPLYFLLRRKMDLLRQLQESNV